MLKRIFAASGLFLAAGQASASPELAEIWRAKAEALSAESVVLLQDARHGRLPALDEDYVIELERFALNAGRLAAWSDAAGSPSALGCTFRSLGEETEDRIEALEAARDPGASETALEGLMEMFGDAKSLSAAAIWASGHDRPDLRPAGGPEDCPLTAPAYSRIAAR